MTKFQLKIYIENNQFTIPKALVWGQNKSNILPLFFITGLTKNKRVFNHSTPYLFPFSSYYDFENHKLSVLQCTKTFEIHIEAI